MVSALLAAAADQDVVIDVLPTQLPGWSLLAAVLVGAVAGAAYAAQRGFDVVGILVLAVAQGLGGVLLRDTLLQRGTSVVLLDGRYLLVAALAAVLGFFFAGLIDRLDPLVVLLDALALGILCTLGANAALLIQLSWVSALFIGAATAAGGLVLRDLLAGEPPRVLRPGVVTAAVGLFGAGVYIALVTLTALDEGQAQVITVITVFVVRVLAVRLRWTTRPASDLGERVWSFWSREGTP